MILNVGFALYLSNYTLLKRFICLESILKNISTKLHSQLNYHTLPVTPFKQAGSGATMEIYKIKKITKCTEYLLMIIQLFRDKP